MELKYAAPGEGMTYYVLGGDIVTIKADTRDTEGAYVVLETEVPSQGGPPPHVHHCEEESYYVLEGEFEFHVGEQTETARPGAFLIAPRNVPHHFRNIGMNPGRLLVIVKPAGFERFIEEVARLPRDGAVDPGLLQEIAHRYGVEFV
ncbi:MAG TPA: cupin domain-containing protein [Planctomycetaceae bacterium]|nr:cupin domain-containing protein [Planctomycetaceae bacterium]